MTQAEIAVIVERKDRAGLIALARGMGEPWGDAIAQMLQADHAALRGLFDALGPVWGDPENCDDCAAVSESGNDDTCTLHGPMGTPLYQAIQAALELIGPCVCGHPKSRHEDVDSTHCLECRCQRFALLAQPVTEAR